MIYSFLKEDSRKRDFISLLRSCGVDFELVEHDSAVIRILGAVSPELHEKLEAIRNGSRKLTFRSTRSGDCYTPFTDQATLVLIAGPCALESDEQMAITVDFLAGRGVKYLRGGAYKPRTSCSSFQGLGKPGLELLSRHARRAGMYVVTEVMDKSQLEAVTACADILQVGSRNMFNYTLLTALGSVAKPVLLKRGMAATIAEWLQSAEYISKGGNDRIILCERGIRTFEPQTSHTLDLAAVCLAAQESGYPVVADTSHACGRPDLVSPLAAAAVAAGAAGLMVEIHPDPTRALSDGKQALTFEQFALLQERASRIHAAMHQ
jgi:3-deoxy-7-phosphoheptulonate synthase